jgi:hypothetical protein
MTSKRKGPLGLSFLITGSQVDVVFENNIYTLNFKKKIQYLNTYMDNSLHSLRMQVLWPNAFLSHFYYSRKKKRQVAEHEPWFFEDRAAIHPFFFFFALREREKQRHSDCPTSFISFLIGGNPPFISANKTAWIRCYDYD